jgi:excisionase family DNA binding protein
MHKQLLVAVPFSACNQPVPRKLAPEDCTSSPIRTGAPGERSDPTLLTLDEAATWLSMSVKSVQRRIKAGLIRKAPLGGRLVRISSDELRRLTTNSLVSDKPEDTDPI